MEKIFHFFIAMLLLISTANAQISNNTVVLNSAQVYETSTKARSIILWNNTNINIVDGLPGGTSTYWSVNDNWAWVADDFDADTPWIIEKIYSRGYYPDDEAIPASKMAIVIYENDAGKPGAEIYRNNAIEVANVLEPEIVLPTPFQLPCAGKYWITIAAAYDFSVSSNAEVRNIRWYITRGLTQKGCNYHYYDKMGLFVGYTPATWVDAGPLTTLFSAYFKIEGDPGVPFACEPITNLTVDYDAPDCTKAEITWSAPTEGDFIYIVYRDDEEIATVETESYTDVTFDPILEHTWGIKVVCDGFTPTIDVFKPICFFDTCSLQIENLTVTYNESCNAAVLEWELPEKMLGNAPPKVLWDNTQPANSGYESTRHLYEAFSRNIKADDFVVSPGEIWNITEVYFGGFHITVEHAYIAPAFIGIEIYKDNGNDLPGEKIYENAHLTSVSGNYSLSYQTVILPDPVQISVTGKYWISIYGVYEDIWDDEYRYYIYAFSTPIGAPLCYLDEWYGTWAVLNGTLPSMYFRLLGNKIIEVPVYNIYRDGVAIANNVLEPTYTDYDFDPNLEHTWSVTALCYDGIESAPVDITMEACGTPCIPVTGSVAEVGCKTAIISWIPVENATAYKVSRDGILLATVSETTCIEERTFEDGVTYTWEIVTVCNNTESGPVEVAATANCEGIQDIGLTSFTIIPNPASSKITISAGVNFNTVEILNFLGQVIISQSVDKNSVGLDVSYLTNGIYFVRVTSDKGIGVKKFIKH